MNRFKDCKTLKHLYEVFATEEGIQDFENLSVEELDRVAMVFEANKPENIDMPDTPLTEAGYTFIWNVTVDTVEANKEDETMMNNANETINNATIKEEKVMTGTVRGNVEAAVEEMMGKFTEAKKNVLHQAGETKDEYIEKVDDSLNVMKGALGTVLGTLDGVLGYSVLKDAVLDMMEAGSDGKTSKKDLFKMARKCRELIEEEIENLEAWGDEESFKKAVQLKALTEGARGKSVFEAFVSGVIWVARTTTKKVKGWVDNLDEKSIIGAICRSIAGFVNVLRAGVKIVWNAVKFAASFVVAGVVKIADFIVRAVKSVVTKIKNWTQVKDEVVEETDDFEDDEDIIDEELV